MKEILNIADELRQDNVPEPIIKEAIWLICETEATLAITELNQWVEESKKNIGIVFK